MQESPNTVWNSLRRFGFRWLFVLVVSLMATYPFSRPLLPDLGKLLSPITTEVAMGTKHFLGIPGASRPELASDNLLLYVHVGNMLLFSLVVALYWSIMGRPHSHPRLEFLLVLLARYFLAAAMLSYGFAKVFKHQFYLPEPNTLYTPLGEVPRDLLFWSTMGSSHAYSAFLGWVEVMVGVLLLSRRTQTLGATIGLGVMANVLAINLAFDISVKVYASLLLLLCLVILAPEAGRLMAVALGREAPPSSLWLPTLATDGRKRLAWLAKAVVVGLLFLDATWPMIRSGNFNDDVVERPFLHGAYAVTDMRAAGRDVPACDGEGQRWRRVFVHRDGYFIIQGMDDKLRDYKMSLDRNQRLLLLHDISMGEFHYFWYHEVGGQLQGLEGVYAKATLQVKLQALDWRSLPLLRGEFHWSADAL